MIDKKHVLNGVKSVVLDLDGTLYDKRGLAHRMVRRLFWCLPLLASERLARRNMHYLQFATGEEFYDCFFHMMARGHWWNAKIAAKWYELVYMPAMIRLIAKRQPVRQEVLDLIAECKEKGIKMAIFSDYGCVVKKLEALHVDPGQFDLLVSAPEMGSLKPSESCARRVLELMGAEAETTLFVGDRDEKDGAAARSVGAKFLLVNGNW